VKKKRYRIVKRKLTTHLLVQDRLGVGRRVQDVLIVERRQPASGDRIEHPREQDHVAAQGAGFLLRQRFGG
jgi:hypothetical protein